MRRRRGWRWRAGDCRGSCLQDLRKSPKEKSTFLGQNQIPTPRTRPRTVPSRKEKRARLRPPKPPAPPQPLSPPHPTHPLQPPLQPSTRPLPPWQRLNHPRPPLECLETRLQGSPGQQPASNLSLPLPPRLTSSNHQPQDPAPPPPPPRPSSTIPPLPQFNPPPSPPLPPKGQRGGGCWRRCRGSRALDTPRNPRVYFRQPPRAAAAVRRRRPRTAPLLSRRRYS